MLVEDLERELQNWALWRCAGGWAYTRGSAGLVADYSPIATRYREAVVPVLSGAANDVDVVVNRLETELRAVLYAQYLRIDQIGRRIPSSFAIGQIARALQVPCRTFERHLAAARQAVSDGLHANRRRVAVAERP